VRRVILDYFRNELWFIKMQRGNSSVDKKLLNLLVCPVTKSALQYDKAQQELISVSSGLAYPVRDGIPVMLEGDARVISAQEKEHWQAKKTALAE
jgi:uncharacterized protein YbaR (Trm112 family)